MKSGQKTRRYIDRLPVSPWYVAFGIVPLAWLWRRWKNKHPVPTYGGILSVSRSLALLRLVNEGPSQYLRWYENDPMVFIPRPDTWALLVHSKYIDEISRAPEDQLSFTDAAATIFQTRYNFGQWVVEDHFHHEVIRKQITRNLSTFCPLMFEEIQDSIAQQVPIKGDESVTVTVFFFIQHIIARASNRVFVGLPYCRDERWLTLARNTALDTVKVAAFINRFPEKLRPIVGRLVSPTESRITKAVKVIGPLVEAKLAYREAHPSSPPQDDYISWLIAQATDRERNVRGIVNRLLVTNFAAIHTSTTNVTQALYWLLSRPQYINLLREEIQQVTEHLGWSRNAIGSMPKLDSFMKECMRLTPISPQTMNRVALRPFTFSNGLQVPAGTSMSSHAYGTHLDQRFYSNAQVFDGFRFFEANKEEKDEVHLANPGDDQASAVKGKQTMYTTSPTYLSFGHGIHACPGRFFASMEVKLIFAHLIYNYDISWPPEVYAERNGNQGGYRPADVWYGAAITPSQEAKMVLRKRGSA